MKNLLIRSFVALLLIANVAIAADALPSWNDTAHKKAIISFVEQVTKEGSPSFVPPAERIATFDNDGTLWSEQPAYVEFTFTLERIKALAPQHPEWSNTQPFKAVLEDDTKTVAAGGETTALELIVASRAGCITEDFANTVTEWLMTAKHPKTGRPYTEMVFQPMLELLAYLRDNRFKTYIVSGGGQDFMRPWTEMVYGIPPEQVVGTSLKTKVESRNGKPEIVLMPEINLDSNNEGKPIGINQNIGRRPIAAFGNSDGDLPMLQWTTAGRGTRFALLVHHTDAEREVAYDRASSVGRLDKALDEAEKKGWTVVDMKNDWNVIYPFEKK